MRRLCFALSAIACGLGLGTTAAADPLPPPVVRGASNLSVLARRAPVKRAPTQRATIKAPTIRQPRTRRRIVAAPLRVATVKAAPAKKATAKLAAKPIARRKRIVVPPPSKPVSRLVPTKRAAPKRTAPKRTAPKRFTPAPKVRRVTTTGKQAASATRRAPTKAKGTSKSKMSHGRISKAGALGADKDDDRVVLIPVGVCEGDT